jgi:hypothetical protein
LADLCLVCESFVEDSDVPSVFWSFGSSYSDCFLDSNFLFRCVFLKRFLVMADYALPTE